MIASLVADVLGRAVPDPRCELKHTNGFELLIATILSAQSTDKRVNSVTPELFRRYPTPVALAAAPLEILEDVLRPTGFYRQKSISVKTTSQAIVDDFGGELPRTLKEMTKLRGVARKTANLVLGTVYGIPTGIVVDTHVKRVSARLGLTVQTDPAKVEKDLMGLFSEDQWIGIGHRILLHGRYTCVAKKPMCAACPLNEACPAAEHGPEDTIDARIASEARRVADALAYLDD